MATATRPRLKIGPDDRGRRMTLAEFIRAEAAEGWLYELARGVVEVTEVPHPDHGMIVGRLARLFILYDVAHPGLMTYRAGGGECRIRAPGMQSDRHPDQAIYTDPMPAGRDPWTRWIPTLVIEVVSAGGKRRDYVEKCEEYLRIGVREYWVLDPSRRQLLVHRREGDTWGKKAVPAGKSYRCALLPGLIVRPAELLGAGPGGRGR